MKIRIFITFCLLISKTAISSTCFYTKPVEIFKLEGCSNKICISDISCLENGLLKDYGPKSCRQVENGECPTPTNCLKDTSYQILENGITLKESQNSNESNKSKSVL